MIVALHCGWFGEKNDRIEEGAGTRQFRTSNNVCGFVRVICIRCGVKISV